MPFYKTIHNEAGEPTGILLEPDYRENKDITVGEEKFLSAGTCFFDTLAFILQEAGIETKKVRDYARTMDIGYTQYAKCRLIFKAGITKISSNLIKTIIFKDGLLKRNLLGTFNAMLTVSRSLEDLNDLTPQIGEQYIDDFLKSDFLKNQNLEQAPLGVWLQKASDFFEEQGREYFWGRFARAELAKMKVSAVEIEAIFQERMPEFNHSLIFCKEEIILFDLLQEKIMKQYGSNFPMEMSWHPRLPCEALKQLIATKGYLMVTTTLGPQFYEISAKKQNINGITVFYWPKNAKRKELPATYLHMVVLVGVNTSPETGERVFYIDPTTDKGKTPYPIYMTSYESFCQRLSTIEATPLNGNGYFTYCSALTPRPLPSVPHHSLPTTVSSNSAVFLPAPVDKSINGITENSLTSTTALEADQQPVIHCNNGC